MPVQIPTLERIAPQAPTSIGRTDTSVASPVQGDKAIEQAATGVVNEYADYQAKAEQHANEMIATKAANDFEVKKRMSLAELSKKQGDTTEDYNQLTKDSVDWQNQIVEQYGKNTQLKNLINEKIQTRDYALRDRAATQQGAQYETYKKKVYDSAATLIGQGMMDTAQTIDAKNPDSLLELHNQVDRAKRNRIEQGQDAGLVAKKPDGSIIVSPITKAQILTDVSGHLTSVVKTLNSMGKTDEAKLVMDQFSDDIKGDDKAKLLTDHKESIVKQQALGAVQNIVTKYKSPDEQMAATAKIPDLEVQQKARDFIATRTRQNEQAKDAAGKDMHDNMSKYVRDGISQGKWADLNAFRDDPFIKNAFSSGKMKQPQIDSLEQQFAAPKTSDPKAEMKIWNEITSGEFKNNSPEDLAQKLVGTSKPFRDKMMNKLISEQSATGTQQNAILSQMHKKLDGVLYREKRPLDVSFYGDKIDPGEASKWHTLIDNDLSQNPEGLNMLKDPLKAGKYVEDFIADAKKNALFDPNAVAARQKAYRFQSAPKPKASDAAISSSTPPPPAQAPLAPLDTIGRKEWAQKFYKATGRPFDASKGDDMDKFRRENK